MRAGRSKARGLDALLRVLVLGEPANDTAPATAPATGLEPVRYARSTPRGRCCDPGCDWCQSGEPHPWERTPAAEPAPG